MNEIVKEGGGVFKQNGKGTDLMADIDGSDYITMKDICSIKDAVSPPAAR